MDSADKFYSGFPSLAGGETRRQALAKERQIEYHTFLQNQNKGKSPPPKNRIGARPKENKSPKKSVTVQRHIHGMDKRSNRNDDVDASDHVRMELRSRDNFLAKLEKMSVPDIFNDVKIDARNKLVEEEKRLKQSQYQEELKAQIEEKRRAKENRRTLDLEEEERLNRKIDAQRKLMGLELQIERQSKDPINTPSPRRSKVMRSEPSDTNAYSFRSYDERHVGNGKENVNENKVYKYFTNSARDVKESIGFRHTQASSFDRSPPKKPNISPKKMPLGLNTYPMHKSNDACNTHHDQSPQSTRSLCNFCKEKRSLTRSQTDNINNSSLFVCGSCEDIPICLKCRQEICSRCKRPIKIPKPRDQSNDALTPLTTRSELLVANNYSTTGDFKLSPILSGNDTERHLLDTTDDDDNTSNCSSRPPYSFNIKETSVFHPSNTTFNRYSPTNLPIKASIGASIPFEELKRITDAKLSKYTRNYGDFIKSPEHNRLANVDSFPMPLLRENVQEMSLADEDHSSDGNSNAFRFMQTKWQVPAVQKNSISQNFDTNTRTLTQTGAIRKQLQLEKLNFGDEHHDDRNPSPRS